MKSKFFIYILPLILGVVATILMLNAPQPQKGVPKKPVAPAPSASVPPVIPEVAENKEEAIKEEAAEDEKTEEAEQTEETEETEDEETEEAEETVETDKLREAFVSHAKTISQNELWLEFIARDDALLRCVKAVDSIAAGDIPIEPLDFLKPKTPFSASLNAVGLLVVTVEAIARYKTAMDALRSIDMQAATALYNEIEPVLDELFHELGYPETKTFRGRLTEACTVILETPVMKGEGGLVHVAANLYKYSNPQLESLLPVQKLLIRLGETNREEIRRRVLEFSAQLKLYAE
ncbi:MAG: DUF3014 domain-containing protein [Victivallales bacterium]|nr:DUF3014 domain-containing protein [Victivallales bacterium]